MNGKQYLAWRCMCGRMYDAQDMADTCCTCRICKDPIGKRQWCGEAGLSMNHVECHEEKEKKRTEERFIGKCPKCGGECQCVRWGQMGEVTRCAYCKEPSLTIDFKEVKPRVSCPHCEKEPSNTFGWDADWLKRAGFHHKINASVTCEYCGEISKSSEWIERKPKETQVWLGSLERKKEPIGLKPRYLHDEFRLVAIQEAVERYAQARKPVPQEWIDEWVELVGKLGKVAESEVTSA